MNRTAAEAQAECVGAMGPELGEIYSALWQEVALIHSKWNEFVVLYGTKESRIDLLNQAAPRFARLIQDVLWDDVLLHLARLTDVEKSTGIRKLSIRALPALVKDTDTKIAVAAAVNVARSACEFARDWRNRRLAHLELAVALDPGAKPLAPASRQHVNQALQSLAAALNVVSQRYLNSTSLFDIRWNDAGGALSLLHVLHDGVRTQEARDARLKSGIFDLSDMSPNDL